MAVSCCLDFCYPPVWLVAVAVDGNWVESSFGVLWGIFGIFYVILDKFRAHYGVLHLRVFWCIKGILFGKLAAFFS